MRERMRKRERMRERMKAKEPLQNFTRTMGVSFSEYTGLMKYSIVFQPFNKFVSSVVDEATNPQRKS